MTFSWAASTLWGSLSRWTELISCHLGGHGGTEAVTCSAAALAGFDYLAAAVVLVTPGAVVFARAYLRQDLLARMIFLVQAAAWKRKDSSSKLLLFEDAWAQAVETQRSSFELGLLGMAARVEDIAMREQVRTAVFASEGVESGAVFANGKTVDAIQWVDDQATPQPPIMSPVRLRTPLQ